MHSPIKLQIDENGRMFFKLVENIVGKGEIALMRNFSFSHSVFKRLMLQTRKNQGSCGQGLRGISPFPTAFSKDFYCRHVKTRACVAKG